MECESYCVKFDFVFFIGDDGFVVFYWSLIVVFYVFLGGVGSDECWIVSILQLVGVIEVIIMFMCDENLFDVFVFEFEGFDFMNDNFFGVGCVVYCVNDKQVFVGIDGLGGNGGCVDKVNIFEDFRGLDEII